MSERDWLRKRLLVLGAAVIGVLIVAGLVVAYNYRVEHAAQREQSANYPTEAAQKEIAKICERETFILGDLLCSLNNIGPTQEARQDQYDLQAQQDMAEWALWGLFVAIATAWVTAIGVFYVARTLDATNAATGIAAEANVQATRANDIAEKSEKAAWAAVDATKDIGYRQTRAYPSLESAKVRIRPDKVEVLLEFFNSGQTPALHMHIPEYFSVINLIPNDGTPRPDMLLAVSHESSRFMTIGAIASGKPKTPSPAKIGFLTSDVAALNQFGGVRLFRFQGILQWEDAFDRKHEEALSFAVPITSSNDWLPCGLVPRVLSQSEEVQQARVTVLALRIKQAQQAHQDP